MGAGKTRKAESLLLCRGLNDNRARFNQPGRVGVTAHRLRRLIRCEKVGEYARPTGLSAVPTQIFLYEYNLLAGTI